MSRIEPLYKYLNSNDLETLSFSFGEPSFSFTDEYKNDVPLPSNSDKDAFYIESEKTDWSSIQNGIKVRINAQISNCKFLNENNPNAIAFPNSELSIALIWVALESRDQGFAMEVPLQSIDAVQNLSFDVDFPKGKYHGTIVFSFVLLLNKPGDVSSTYGINNTKGIILGILDKFKLRLNGEGSIFPVFFQDIKGEELWKLSLDIDDPESNMFDQSIKLLINRKNPDYIYLDRKSSKYCPRLEKEIMAESISEFLIYLQDNFPKEFSNIKMEDYSEGTVLFAAKYMLSRIVQTDSAKEILDKVREEFTKEG